MNSNINEKMLANLSVRLIDLPEIPCPCGSARRAFSEICSGKVSLHLVEVKEDSELHYHKKQTEIYYILSGSGEIEINRKIKKVSEGDAIFIPAGVVHRPIPGPDKMSLLNFVIPAFDSRDEWLVSEKQ